MTGDAFDRHGVDVVFHGHAHHGALEGRTSQNIPVHNTSRFARMRMGEPPYPIYAVDQ